MSRSPQVRHVRERAGHSGGWGDQARSRREGRHRHRRAGAIGTATAERLARAGATVAIADVRDDAAASLADRLRTEGLAARAFQVNLTQEAEIQALVENVVEAFGRIDILHNNAAANLQEAPNGDRTLLEISAKTWDVTFSVNVRGPMLLSKYVVAQMLKQGGGGVIVNMSSGASQVPSPEARIAYGASKAALETLTRYTAAQYGAQGVRCNAILPGVVLTPGMREMFTAEQLDAMTGRTMLRRACTPEDIAAMVRFLVSDDARQITGELVRVNGGTM
jgi:NAD(P)-dependent dehydrogenase (short-subunit alcohol dehydrogenase family)